jgi:RNA recognition motif-containing protein
VGNLFYETTDQDVVGLFSGLGIDVVDVFVPQTPEGVSKGIAFVTLRNPAQVDEALGKVNGVLLRGRALYVELARAKESHPQE